jgi:ABC-type multidrug transport system fused ATPase/permease subunit
VIARARAALTLMASTVGRGRLAGLVALQLAVAVMEGLGLVLLVPVIQALDGSTRLGVPGLSVRLSLAQAFTLVIAVVCLRGLAQWRTAVLAVDIRLTTVDALRLQLIDDLYRSDWSFLATQRRSHLVQSLTTDVERVHSALAMVLRLVVGALVLLATAAVAVLLSPVVGGLAVLALVMVGFVAARSTRGATQLGRVMTERMAGFGAALSDSLASLRVMRAHDASAAWSRLVGEEAGRVRDVRRSFVARSGAISAVTGVAAVVAVLVLILAGREAGMSLAELAALAVVATRLLTSAQGLLTAAQLFANDVAALDRLQDFAAAARAHPEPATTPGPGPDPGPAPAVRAPADAGVPLLRLRDVGVTYTGDTVPALSGVDLAVPRGGLVVVTGPSGAGKSTLLDVVLGLLRPDAGEVCVDGAPLEDLASWRRRIGYVPQQTVLVPGTVWQNLAWSVAPGSEPTAADAWKALRTACVDDVVRALPGDLEAPLHELTQLSGGEQQRLSIARALLRDPELLVLDEATGALDRETEERLLDRLLDGSRAVLMVTHRDASRRGGAGLHLERGRPVPAGSPDPV